MSNDFKESGKYSVEVINHKNSMNVNFFPLQFLDYMELILLSELRKKQLEFI